MAGALALILAALLLAPVSRAADDSAPEAGTDSLLQRGRALYYEAVENEEALVPALETFARIAERDSALRPRARVYRGSLLALRGKHAFLPNRKLSLTNEGLDVLDSAAEAARGDVEALFIRGSTLWHLPFFFKRREDARRAFEHMIPLMAERADTLDPGLLSNVIGFLREEVELTAQEDSLVAAVVRRRALEVEP